MSETTRCPDGQKHAAKWTDRGGYKIELSDDGLRATCGRCGVPIVRRHTKSAQWLTDNTPIPAESVRGILAGTVNLHTEAEADAKLGAALRAAVKSLDGGSVAINVWKHHEIYIEQFESSGAMRRDSAEMTAFAELLGAVARAT